MSKILWIVGEPGVGKTTLAKMLIADWRRQLEGPGDSLIYVRHPKFTSGIGWLAAGHYVGKAFDGSDTLPISQIKEVVPYWAERQPPITLFEGDKLATEGCLREAVAAGAQPLCIHMMAIHDDVQQRRDRRGSKQNETWIKGRKTKAARFADLFKEGRLEIDTSGFNALEVAGTAAAWLHRQGVFAFTQDP